jgi:hypothetical protein
LGLQSDQHYIVNGDQMDDSLASQLRLSASRLVTERQRLEKTLMEHRRFLRGSLLERPRFCGKAGCKCTKGQPHPPGLCLSRLVDGTVRQVFIRASDHTRARKEALAYKEYRQALRHWRAIEKELNTIWEDLETAQEERYPFE